MPTEPSPAAFGHGQPILTAPEIDGLVPADMIVPDSPQAIADVLADAADRSLAVAPVGGCTSLGIGNVPERLDLALSTSHLTKILDYEPMDLVVSVGAGTRFGDLQAVLAEHGQTIPIEAPNDASATVGGLIATAQSGPRRLGSGTLRDLLIGISVAHPSGTVTKAGGMVVKNVTGFDLTRLYLGSLGTLGVVVSANFKVLPLPRMEATVLRSAPDLDSALGVEAAVRSSSLQPVASEVAYRDGVWLAAVRIEGRESALTAMANTLASILGGESVRLDGPDSAGWWRRYVDEQTPSVADDHEVVVRLGVRPRGTADLLRTLATVVPAKAFEVASVAASPGLGAVVVRLRSADVLSARGLRALQDGLLRVADGVTILGAGPVAKRAVDVWGRLPDTIDLMRTLKAQFDPGNVLNPGRFAGRI